VNGSEPFAAGTGRLGTATGTAPPAAPDGLTALALWFVPFAGLWGFVAGRGLPLEPPVAWLPESDGLPLEPVLPGGGCVGYWSAAAWR
jgi:hypothetical protein